MAEDISTLVVKVSSEGIRDTAKDLDALTKAAEGAEGATKKLGTAVTSGASASDAQTGTSKALADALGKVTEAINRLTNATQLATDAALKNAEAQRATGQAAEEAGSSAKKAAGGHGSNAAAIRETLVLLHEASQGQFKRFGGSLLVLANQWNVIPGIIAAVGAATFAVGVVVTAAFALMGYAVISGANEMAKFQRSLILTGNMAGLTRDSLHEMSLQLADNVTGGAHHAQLVLEELTATGKFSGETLESVGKAALAFEHLTGESGEKVIKIFDGMSDGVTNWAKKANESYHFLTYAQYEEIKVLEIQGEKQKAMQVATDAMAKSMDDHGRKVGVLIQYYRDWAAGIDKIKGWFASIGAGATDLEKFQQAGADVLKAKAEFDKVNNKPASQRNWFEIQALPELKTAYEKANKVRLDAQEQFNKTKATAAAKAEAAEVTQSAIDADKQAEVEARRNRTRSEKMEDDLALDRNTTVRRNAGLLQTELAARGISYTAIMAAAKKQDQDEAAVKKQNGQLRVNDLSHEFDEQMKIRQQYGLTVVKDADEQAKSEAAIKDRWKERKTPGSDDSAALRDGALQKLRADLQEQLQTHEEFQRHSKELAEKQGGDERAALADRDKDRADMLVKINADYAKELEIIRNHGANKSKLWLAQNKERENKADKDHTMAVGAINNEGEKDATAVASREFSERQKITKEINNAGEAENKRLDSLIKAEGDRVAAVGQLKSVTEDFRAGEEMADAMKAAAEADELNSITKLGQEYYGLSDDEAAYNKLQMGFITDRIKKHEQLSAAYKAQAVEQRKVEAADRTTKNLDDALAAAKRFEKGMTDAFGKIGKAVGGIGVAFVQMGKDQDTAHQAYMKSSQEEKDNGTAQAKLDADTAQAQIAGYGGMADAAQGMFSENSKGYQAMGAVSKVFHMAEAAMQAARIIQLGIAAVLTQGEGDPYTAFARMAAMTALVVGLGVALSGGGGSGGGKSAAEVQKTQGTGTVFGDTGTKQSDGSTLYTQKSASISKSLELLKDNSNIMLPVNEAMLASLKAIQSSMGGLANLIVRSSGVTDGSNLASDSSTSTLGSGKTLTSAGLGIGAGAGAYYGATAGAILGPLGVVLGAGIGAVLGTVAGKLASLWGKTTQTVVDSGVQFGGKVSNLQNGQGFNQYASVDTTKSSWFGLSKSTSNSVQTQGLSAELSDQFGLIFTNLESTMKVAATALGKNAGDVGNAIENMVLSTTTVSLKGLTGDDLTNAINNVISAAMDQIAQTALPGMDDFRQVGEGYSETVVRVATGVQTATGALEQLGIKAIAYTAIVNKQGDVGVELTRQSLEAAESAGGALSGIGVMISTLDGTVDDLVSTYKALDTIRKQMNSLNLNGNGLNVNVIKGAGGVSNLNNDLTNYQDKFFTDAEKSAIMVKSLTAEFGKLGLAVPTSEAALRALIETTGVSTDATATLTGQLLGLTGAYADAVDAQATANSTATDALNTSIDALSKFADTIKTFKESLLTGDLSNLTPTEKYLEAKKEYESTVAKAMAGDATAQDQVTGYAQSYLEASRVVNASDPAYTASLEQVQADMDKLQAYTGTQLTDAQTQLAVLTKQATSLDTLNMTADSINANLATLAGVTMPTPVVVSVDTSTADQIAELRKEAADQAAASSAKIDDLTAALYDATGKAAVTTSGGLSGAITSAARAATIQKNSYER